MDHHPALLAPSRTCYALIRHFEGCRLQAYLCPAHVPTIGYGATGPDIKLGLTWTQAQADTRLQADVMRFGLGVRALLLRAPTTQGIFDALVSFAHNAGLDHLKTSTLLKLHLAGDHPGAADEFGKWVYGDGVVLPGLVERRKAEAAL